MTSEDRKKNWIAIGVTLIWTAAIAVLSATIGVFAPKAIEEYEQWKREPKGDPVADRIAFEGVQTMYEWGKEHYPNREFDFEVRVGRELPPITPPLPDIQQAQEVA